MAEFTSVGYGIGEGLKGIAEGLRRRQDLQLQERDRQADQYANQARDIAANIAQLGGMSAPEAQPYLDQLKETISKHNALYAPHETPALIQRLQRLFGGQRKAQGQEVASPTSVPAMPATKPGEMLPGQLDTQGQTTPWQQTVANVPGLIEAGNIENLFNRPVLNNPDGSWSTTSSTSFEEDGQEILVPTVVNGQRLTEQQAIDHYHQTGEHLGKFKDSASADTYATALHNEQQKRGPNRGENISKPPEPGSTAVPSQRLLPRSMQVSGPGARPPLEWLSPQEVVAGAKPRQNAILQELQDLRQAFKAGGQSDDEAGKSAMTAIQNKYGTLPPAQKAPRIERDPVTRDVISVTDETTGQVYNTTNIAKAPANVQQAWNAARQGQEARPPEAGPSIKTEFELFMRDNPNATVQDWAEFKAKEARKGKTRKEQITENIADAFEKGDRAGVKRLQSELMAIDPAGAERLAFAAENIGLREAASVARQEAAKEKRVGPLRSIVDTGANAHRLKQMADAGNASADVDLTLEFFKVIRGADGSGIRFSRNEQDFITGARGLSESLEVRGNQVFSNGQPLATEQRQRMVDVMDIHASAAQRRIDEIQTEEPVTPASLKEKAKPRSATPKASTPGSEKESLLQEINKF